MAREKVCGNWPFHSYVDRKGLKYEKCIRCDKPRERRRKKLPRPKPPPKVYESRWCIVCREPFQSHRSIRFFCEMDGDCRNALLAEEKDHLVALLKAIAREEGCFICEAPLTYGSRREGHNATMVFIIGAMYPSCHGCRSLHYDRVSRTKDEVEALGTTTPLRYSSTAQSQTRQTLPQ